MINVPLYGAAVLFPVVALSTAFEGYRWTGLAVVGLVIIVGGNILVLTRIEGMAKRPARGRSI